MRYRPAPIALLVLACAPAPEPIVQAERHHRFVFTGVNVVHPEWDTVVPDVTVHVENGRIASVGKAASAEDLADALVVRGKGAYLMPGLVDMHVHHYPAYGDADLVLYLANGVTTVRNMRGSERDLEVRRRIADGELIGPRYVTCGRQLEGRRELRGAASAESTVVATARAGYDCVKVYTVFSRSAFERAVEVADSLDIRSTGHVQPWIPLEYSLMLGSVEHVERSGLQLFFGHRMPDPERHGPIGKQMSEGGTYLTPTLAALQLHRYVHDDSLARLRQRPETRYVPPQLREESVEWRESGARDRTFDEFRAHYRRALAITGFLHRHGVPMLFGTDSGGLLGVPGFAVHDELRALVDAGLTPAEALTTATANAADLLASNGGRIEVGRAADLVLLAANPLDDVAHVREVVGVLRGDLWMDSAMIRANLHRLEP